VSLPRQQATSWLRLPAVARAAPQPVGCAVCDCASLIVLGHGGTWRACPASPAQHTCPTTPTRRLPLPPQPAAAQLLHHRLQHCEPGGGLCAGEARPRRHQACLASAQWSVPMSRRPTDTLVCVPSCKLHACPKGRSCCWPSAPRGLAAEAPPGPGQPLLVPCSGYVPMCWRQAGRMLVRELHVREAHGSFAACHLATGTS
jgi:hypothetical protein